MTIDFTSIDRLLAGKTTPEETAGILAAIANRPELEEYVITRKRLDYTDEQIGDYGSFIPAGSMAADDGNNLCDLQCEAYILRRCGIEVPETELSAESKGNYWLKDQGTPLFNMGKLLESKGFLVNRKYDATFDELVDALQAHSVIAVVNGDVLKGTEPDILSDDFSMEDTPNHAVVILGISGDTVSLYNPAGGNEDAETSYPLTTFLDAWGESRHYLVMVRKKRFPEEYNPQPIDVSNVSLNPELLELTEMIAENAHDVWAVRKRDTARANGFEMAYAPLDAHKQEVPGHNHFYIPYALLSEEDKMPDREMALGTIRLVKRLGYRLVNINSMYRCPSCGGIIEPSHNFCPNCGKELTWEDFR